MPTYTYGFYTRPLGQQILVLRLIISSTQSTFLISISGQPLTSVVTTHREDTVSFFHIFRNAVTSHFFETTNIHLPEITDLHGTITLLVTGKAIFHFSENPETAPR